LLTGFFMIRSILLTCLFFFFVSNATAQGQMLSWKKINRVALLDGAGKKIHIDGDRLTVFVMLSPECPLCKNYAPVLNDLQKQYPEVAFYGIFPGKAYDLDEISHFQKEYQITSKLLMDPQKVLSKYLSATTTPECIFINKLGVTVYRGLIDNWASGLGQKRKVITEKYLSAALGQTKSGMPVAIRQTKPVGCLINDL
jgi:thiol-disulfide isomerase/thioredoxin